MGEFGLDEVDDKLTAKAVEDFAKATARKRREDRKIFVSLAVKFYNSPKRRIARFIRRCLGKPNQSFADYMRDIELLATMAWGKEDE